MADSTTDFSTIIGADANFKGELRFDSAAKVLGKLEGSITSKGRLHVASGAQCRATVSAKQIAVEGHIEGNVEAGESIEIRPSGVVVGDIVAAKMVMAEGASINGHCTIGPNGHSGGSKSGSAVETKPHAASAQTKSSTPEPAKAR